MQLRIVLVNFKHPTRLVKSLYRTVLEISADSSKFRKDAANLCLKVALLCCCCVACGAQFNSDDGLPSFVQANDTAPTAVPECEEGESSDCLSQLAVTTTEELAADFALRNGNQSPTEDTFSESSETQIVELTLQEAIAHALEFNRDLINARLNREIERLEFEITEEDRWSPRYEISPSLSNSPNSRSAGLVSRLTVAVPTGTGANFGVTLDGPTANSNNTETLGRISFTLSHPVLRGAGRGIATLPVETARIAEERRILALRDAVAGVVRQVQTNYRSLYQSYQQLEIAEGALQRAQNQQNVTKALIEVGRTARRELIRSEATLANRELSLAGARNSLETANFNFVNLVGLEGNVRVLPIDELQATRREGPLVPDIDDVLNRRSDYRQAELAVVSADISLKQAENNLLPNITLGLSADHSDGTISGPRLTLGTTIQLNDRQPRLRLLRARNAKRIAEGDLVERRRLIENNLRQAATSVEERLRQIELAINARELAAENLEIERSKFDQGLSSAFQVSSLGDDLVAAERAEINAVISYLNALTELDQATGRTLEQRGIQLDATSP